MTRNSSHGTNRRQVLGGVAALAGAAVLPPIRISLAQGQAESGSPIPTLLMECYPNQMTVEAARIYARELAELGIEMEVRPLAFGEILGKVYGQHDLTTAMMGFGSPEERLDPDFYIRSIYSSSGSFNAPQYKNPEYDAVALAQQQTPEVEKRRELLAQAQRIYAEDLPSWHVCSRNFINPVNTALFKNFRPSRVLGLELYHVAPYLELEPVGSVKEVNVGTSFRMSSAHPFTERSANGRGFLRFIYDTFLRYDGELNLIPWAAKSYEQVDPTTYDLKLREGMSWHDGKPVTIEDAKFTFDYLLEWKPSFWEFFMNPVQSAEIIDEHTLRVRLHEPSATFLTTTLVQVTILPKHIWERVPGEVGASDPMEWDAVNEGGLIGSGAFRFVGFERDVNCYVQANKEHWTGGPKIDGLNYIQAEGVEQLVGGMEAGTIHIVGDGLSHTDGERLAQHEDIELLLTDSATVVSFWLDNQIAPLNDTAFRHAMYHACPKSRIVEIALGGAGAPARRSPLPPVFTEWIPEDLPADEYDLDKAREILEEAGYKRDGSGRLLFK